MRKSAIIVFLLEQKMSCSGIHKKRLFIGEAEFKGVLSLLNKHKDKHPNLGKSIIATELATFGRKSNYCSKCKHAYKMLSKEEKITIALKNLFLEGTDQQEQIFCSDRCERIQKLKDLGVTVILGFDGTKIHKCIKKTIPRIHWNCPHDRSNYKDQTLPILLKKFFASASKVQAKKDRIYVTLAQPTTPFDKRDFYQGVVYNIREAATSVGYQLYAKRPFSSNRYPGYQHEQTGGGGAAPSASELREFVFIKGKRPSGRSPSHYNRRNFSGFGPRDYYIRDTDNESSDYSDEED